MPYVLHSLANLYNVYGRAADMFVKKNSWLLTLQFPPLRCKPVNPVCSWERWGGGIIKLRLLGQDIRGKEPMTEWDSRFSVRPANTTIYQPVCEFIGSAADI